MGEHLKIANLSAENIARMRALEDSLGVHIMAFEPAVKLAKLTDVQLAEIKALEEELGVTLIVYKT